MDLALWIIASLLAVVALLGGLTKMFIAREKLAAQPGGEWTARVSPRFVKTLGGLELLAAVGFVVPAMVDIAPYMVPVTAICWVLLMIGAMITHLRLGQSRFAMLNLTYLFLAAIVAWGRIAVLPF